MSRCDLLLRHKYKTIQPCATGNYDCHACMGPLICSSTITGLTREELASRSVGYGQIDIYQLSTGNPVMSMDSGVVSELNPTPSSNDTTLLHNRDQIMAIIARNIGTQLP